MKKKLITAFSLVMAITLSCSAKLDLSKKQKEEIGGGSAAVGIGGGSGIGYGAHKHFKNKNDVEIKGDNDIDKEYVITKKEIVSNKKRSYEQGYDHPYTLDGTRSMLHKADDGDTRRRIFFDYSRTKYNLLKKNNRLGEHEARADAFEGRVAKETENTDFYGKTENTFFRYLNDGEDPMEDYGLKGFLDKDGDFHLLATEEDQSQSPLYHAYEKNQRDLEIKNQLARKKEEIKELKSGKPNSTSDVASGTVTTNPEDTGGKAANSVNSQVNSDTSAITGGVNSSQSDITNQQNQGVNTEKGGSTGGESAKPGGNTEEDTNKGGGDDLVYDAE